MHPHWLALSIGLTALAACTEDPIAPHAAHTPLTDQQYALQLRGDPLIRNIAGILGRPDLAARIDDAVTALNYTPAAVSTLLSVRASVNAALNVAADDPVDESDVLSAVVTLTLDRIAQIDSAQSSAANPPPS